MTWNTALELDAGRSVVAGSAAALRAAVARGADLRIYTEFRHNEHIDTASGNPELIQEVSEFRVTYVVDGRWVAGIMSLRQPIELPNGFGPPPSMSFFLYNENGEQAIARPHLDGGEKRAAPGPSPPLAPPNMPKFHTRNAWDAGTNAPSTNFVYDFETYRYCVNDSWREVLAHDAQGAVIAGSLNELTGSFAAGCALKIAVSGLCADLVPAGAETLPHEVIVEAGPGYYYTERRLFMVGSHPVIRVRPAVPMQYESRNWDFGWLMARTDGHVVYRRCDPYTLQFTDRTLRCGVRWFVR